jgi:hypothetical protein
MWIEMEDLLENVIVVAGKIRPQNSIYVPMQVKYIVIIYIW